METICPGCGSDQATTCELERYQYVEAGLEDIVLLDGVREIRCPRCRGTFLQVEDEQQLIQVIAIDLLSLPCTLPGPAQAFLRKSCDLTQVELARRLGIARRETVAEREARSAPLPLDTEFHFRAVILLALLSRVGSEPGCFLAPAHLERLDRLREGLLHLAERGSGEVPRLELLRTPEGHWMTAPDDRAAVEPAA